MVSGTTLHDIVSGVYIVGEKIARGIFGRYLQEDYYFADDAPAGVPDESSVFVERFV